MLPSDVLILCLQQLHVGAEHDANILKIQMTFDLASWTFSFDVTLLLLLGAVDGAKEHAGQMMHPIPHDLATKTDPMSVMHK